MREENLERSERDQAIYLFCLARADAMQCAVDQSVDGSSSLFLWRRDAIVAICNRTPLAEFCGPKAEEHLGDLAWVGPRARCHAEVVMDVMRQSPVFPVRFGTLFSSLERLENLMEKNREKILRFFDDVQAKEEWAVKGWMKRMAVQALLLSQAQASQELPTATSPGGRYLDRQRQRLAVQKEIDFWARRHCNAIAASLAKHSEDFRDRPVQSDSNRDDAGEMTSNWAFLVPCAEQALFQEKIEEANAVHGPQGICFECSGPWPPYSFVPSLEADLDA